MIAQSLLMVAFPALLALAAGFDLASFTIPNFLCLALFVLFAPFALALGLSFPAIAWHLLAGGLALGAGIALFALGYVGGGDAKLFAVVSLWLGWHDLLAFSLATALIGGGLAMAIIALRWFPLPAMLACRGWIAKLHQGESGIPYGVALAAGALLVLPHSEILRLAAIQ